ncbi:MAG TPA: TlpA disulfide reductase family protein [Kofleriaceae bacterium]|nr:TlpA disulfide reductase family protein [Kofleriaceae bacterium]
MLLFAAISLAGACKKGPPGGDITTSLALPTTADAAFDPGTLKGKPTLVVFASPTCGHCFKELPVAQTAAAAEDANVVAVFVVGSKEQAASMASRAKYTATALVDPSGAVRSKYDINAVPYLLVLGPDGHARGAFTGEQDEATLRTALASAR